MAIFVLQRVERSPHPDATKDQRGVHKRWDVITVYGDGYHDGDIVANPIRANCALIKVPGFSLARAKRAIEPETESYVDDDGVTRDRPTRRHAWRVHVSEFSPQIRNAINNNGYREMVWPILEPKLRRKVDGATLPDVV